MKLTRQEIEGLREMLEIFKEYEPKAYEIGMKLLAHIDATKPKVCIVGNPKSAEPFLEMFKQAEHDFVVILDDPLPEEVMALDKLEIEDLEFDVKEAVIKPKSKPSFTRQHRKRGNPWDDMK